MSEFRQWLFYTLRQGFLVWCIAYAVYRYTTSQSEVERARMRRQEPVLLVTAVLCLCILIEDVAMILVFDSSFFAQEALLPLYISERYNLTAREREILKLVLEGKDNQNIASTLQLALGTVKAHVHNILKKTRHATRQELTQDYWKG